jgi:hypothetical protein
LRELQLGVRGLLCFLDENIKNDHALSDETAIEGSANAGSTTWTKLN